MKKTYFAKALLNKTFKATEVWEFFAVSCFVTCKEVWLSEREKRNSTKMVTWWLQLQVSCNVFDQNKPPHEANVLISWSYLKLTLRSEEAHSGQNI